MPSVPLFFFYVECTPARNMKTRDEFRPIYLGRALPSAVSIGVISQQQHCPAPGTADLAKRKCRLHLRLERKKASRQKKKMNIRRQTATFSVCKNVFCEHFEKYRPSSLAPFSSLFCLPLLFSLPLFIPSAKITAWRQRCRIPSPS